MPVWEAYSREAFGDADYDVTPEMFSLELDKTNLGRKIPRLGQREKAAVLHMAVSWINRTWPKNLWQETVSVLVRRGFRVVTIGKGGDFRADPNPGVINGVEVFSLGEIRELMKRASVFVGMDSGMLHVAQTTDVPIVGLFTIANPLYRVVDRKNTKTIALVPQTECKFCLHEQTPPVTFVGCKFSTNHCLTEIKPSDVVEAVMSIAR
jgi:ADP-heptose:LPS heptosyltransferase